MSGYKVHHCRACGREKGDTSDPCTNPDCPKSRKLSQQVIHVHGSSSKPMSACTKHGFHALCQTRSKWVLA